MPHLCTTNIEIICDNQTKLKNLYKLIEKCTESNYRKNGFGKMWLGNIVGNADIGTIDEDKDTDVRCRGWITELELSEGKIHIATETAWEPCIEMWRFLLEKELPEAELIYIAEEPGCEIWWTNDPVYINQYFIDIWDDVDVLNMIFGDDTDCISKATLIAMLQELMECRETDINKLLRLFEESEYSDSAAIHRWEYISEADLR